MARVAGFSQSTNRVYLNVYDLHENNEMLFPVGLGFYHSGVQIGRAEYTFAGGSGIYNHEPKAVPAGVKLRESIDMGPYKGSSRDIDKIVEELRSDFGSSDYHVMNKNCNSFSDAFMMKLLGVPIPGYVNRMAWCGSFFSCLMPDNMNQDPTQQNSSNNSPGYHVSGGRLKTVSKQPASTFSSSQGARLGSTASEGTDESANLVDRRERMRQAALNRHSQSNVGGQM